MTQDDEYEQLPFIPESFAENPEPRCPLVLVLDSSSSMSGERIRQLNEGLETLRRELLADPLASKRVEIAVISFGPVTVQSDFATPDTFETPQLEADGDTPMGEAIEAAIGMVTHRKSVYRENGIAFYRPWIFLITDGEPTDDWTNAARGAREGDDRGSFTFYAVGVEGADLETLARISLRPVKKLSGLRFKELFQWLSQSMKVRSQSKLGDRVELPKPDGWSDA